MADAKDHPAPLISSEEIVNTNDHELDREGQDEDFVKLTQVPTLPRVNADRRSQSNNRITARNGGVVHQFINDVGGCSANYR